MKKTGTFLLLLFSVFYLTNAQTNFRVMFYNVENLFDTEDNPEKDDNEFLPKGNRHWTYGRYNNKLNNIAKVITNVGEWGTPAIIGMCEVENEKVMNDLTRYSPLKSQKYQYIVTASDDPRGINIALMYQRDQFKYLEHHAYKISFPKNPGKKTRDILHVTGIVLSGDTMDIFVCHFPSRRSGESESEPDRVQAASIVHTKVDSLIKLRKNANIVIMGDFNDEPMNKSIYETLGAKLAEKDIKVNQLYNLFYKFQKQEHKGSYKYREQWNMLDQIIVSGNLLNRKQNLHVLPESAEIFQRNFMMVNDKTNGGERPKKTYSGMKHEGGFSDHLPVIVDFSVKSSF